MAIHWTLGCDAADPDRLAVFWALALGYIAEPGYEDEFGALHRRPGRLGSGDRLPPGAGTEDVEEPDAHRHPAGWRAAVGPGGTERLIRAKAAELVDAGATRVREENYGEYFGHIVMLDPEGNEFCVG